MANPNDSRPLTGAPLVAAAAAASEPDGAAKVDTPSRAHAEMERHWRLTRALMGGTLAMRDARTEFLPANPVERPEAYELRLARSFLLNAYRDAVTGLAARPFGRPVTLGAEAPERLAGLVDAVDTEGRGLTQFAHDWLLAAIDEGVAHAVVDFPVAPEGGRTLRDEQTQRVRPFWVLTRASNVIAWRSRVVGAEEVLTQLRVREVVTEDEGEWGERDVERVRVYDLTSGVAGPVVTYRLYQRSGDTKEFSLVEGPGVMRGIDRIPLVTFYTRRRGFMVGRPALEDLAWLNLAHWQSASEQRDLLSTARAGILFGAGFDEKEIGGKPEIGKKLWRVSNPQATLKWVEHTGAAMKVGRDDLEDLKAEMAALAMRPLVNQPGTKTATEKSIDTAESDRSLAQWVRNLEAGLRGALALSGQWLGLGPVAVNVDVSDDFGLSVVDRAELADLLAQWEAGAISHRRFLREVKRRGFYAHDFDEDEELREAAEEAEARAARALEIAERQRGAGAKDDDDEEDDG